MTPSEPSPASRREFLTGSALRSGLERSGEKLADEFTSAVDGEFTPSSGDTVRLSTRAMACDFAVIMNPGPSEQVMIASAALDLIHQLEEQMSVYRERSELSELNLRADREPVAVQPQLFDLLIQSRDLSRATKGGFDPTSGPLIALWHRCRQDGRIPTEAEIAGALSRTGMEHVDLDQTNRTVRFDRPGIELNLGGIGKGHALDRAGESLVSGGLNEWLFHGGHSSLLARGNHEGQGGWPVGIRNPLFPQERLGTLLLKDCAMSTSGSGVQSFRHEGRRYGHILDPRTGWPVEGMLSVTVLAPTAAEADALSTAFFVTGVESTRRYCDNHPQVRALLIPPSVQGRSLEIINCGVPEEEIGIRN